MSRTTKTAISGAVGIVAVIAWSIAVRWYLGRNDPPGWIVDRPPYVPPQTLIVVSLLVFLLETEGFHNKIETISRQAFGFRNFQNYRLRVKVLCGV